MRFEFAEGLAREARHPGRERERGGGVSTVDADHIAQRGQDVGLRVTKPLAPVAPG